MAYIGWLMRLEKRKLTSQFPATLLNFLFNLFVVDLTVLLMFVIEEGF